MLSSTLIRKNWTALTGLFLCLFLVVHLVGNLQLLLPAEQAREQFNLYARVLSGSLIIQGMAWLLFASIAAHAGLALALTVKNRSAAHGGYVRDTRHRVSAWHTRNMGLLGVIVLVFIVVHLKDFWYVYMFGAPAVDAEGQKDLYQVVVTAYQQGWYVALNVAAFLALGAHLSHGFAAAFRTLGAYPPRLSRLVRGAGFAFTFVVTGGFVLIPLYIFLARGPS